jgi:NAD(P)-dependent dehydrogenase (short-subunit alcohol dehydrogenase family)
MSDSATSEKVLDGKVVIVTGASRGIGKGLAIGLAEAGAKVVVSARTVDNPKPGLPGTIKETTDAITAAGGTAVAIRCDVGVEEDIVNLIKETVDRFGRIDCLVNNAMAPTRGTFDETTAEMWDESMRVNVRSLFVFSREVIPVMEKHGGGSIINVSSGGAAHESNPFLPPGYCTYVVAKAAMERYSTSLASEVADRGIAINAMRPGAVKTELTTLELPPDTDWSTWQEPKDVVDAVVFLAQQRGDTYTGHVVNSPDYLTLWP